MPTRYAQQGDRAAFISGMEKLAERNLAERQPHPLIEFIFSSHPSIEKRVALRPAILSLTAPAPRVSPGSILDKFTNQEDGWGEGEVTCARHRGHH